MANMELASVMLAIGGDNGNTVQKYGVTPAEVAVLRYIHGDDAITEIEILDDDQVEALGVEEADRSDREEIQRLTDIYGKMLPNGRNSSEAINELFPGAAAKVFHSFAELELDDSFYKAEKRATPKKATARKAPAAKAEEKTEPTDVKGTDQKTVLD